MQAKRGSDNDLPGNSRGLPDYIYMQTINAVIIYRKKVISACLRTAQQYSPGFFCCIQTVNLPQNLHDLRH